jgi:hypothetical protein
MAQTGKGADGGGVVWHFPMLMGGHRQTLGQYRKSDDGIIQENLIPKSYLHKRVKANHILRVIARLILIDDILSICVIIFLLSGVFLAGSKNRVLFTSIQPASIKGEEEKAKIDSRFLRIIPWPKARCSGGESFSS